MTSIIISIGASLVSGSAIFLLQRYFKRKDKSDEKRDAVKARESILILKSINSIGKLTYANTLAIIGGKQNGELHGAMETYAEVSDELYNYLLEQNANKK
jgi:hypothetical protein